jgi:hypothetical protein
MRAFSKYFFAVGIIVSLLIYFSIPDKSDFYKRLDVILILPTLSFLLIPKYLKINQKTNQKLNLGLIFSGAMLIIMLFGNISNSIIKFVYPGFDDFMLTTNLYWSFGLIFFSIGYFFQLSAPQKIRSITQIRPVQLKYIIIITTISFIGAFLSYVSLGFIPFFEGVGTGERYTSVGSTSLYIRLWSICAIAGILAFTYYTTIKKSFVSLAMIITSILISLFFLIRMYPFLIFVTLFLYYVSVTENKKRLYIIIGVFAVFYFVVNASFSSYRESELSANALTEDQSLNVIQKKVFYRTFNEYGQLNTMINTYTAEPQYGKTLLSIPLGFIPAPFLEPFGIVKDDLQSNNSAILFANFLDSKTSVGIRVGILGEFFVNFNLIGCVFMVFIGLAVGFLQKKINLLASNDWRYGYYLIFFVIFLYSLIGQINAIGSLLGNYTILFLILSFFITKFKSRV